MISNSTAPNSETSARGVFFPTSGAGVSAGGSALWLGGYRGVGAIL